MPLTCDHKNIWDDALEVLESKISKANFNTWFKDTFITKIDDGIVYIGVPNTFVRDWLNNKFHKDILKTLRDISNEVRSLEFNVSKYDKIKKIFLEKKSVSSEQIFNKISLF